MSEWISVEERLPEPLVRVVWLYATGEVALYARGADEQIAGEHEPPITHWIPLPDPPEAQDEQ